MSSHSRRGRGGGRGASFHSGRGGSILSRLDNAHTTSPPTTTADISTSSQHQQQHQHHKRRFAGARSSPPSRALREEDFDGDFQMEEDAFGNKRGRSTATSNAPGSCEIAISLPSWQGIQEDLLIGWLQRKSRTGFTVKRTRRIGNDLVITLEDPHQASGLLRLNGFAYGIGGGQTLSIRPAPSHHGSSTGASSSSAAIPAALLRPEVTQLLKSFVQSRYNAQGKLLDLSNVAGVPQIMQAVERMTTGSWSALLKAVSEVCPEVESISFADNHLRTLYPLASLPDMIPNVVNLSFANNQLNQVSTMETCLRKLTKVREIVLTGNPIAEQPTKNGTVAEYRQLIARRFPSLKYLDTLPLEVATIGIVSSPTDPTKRQEDPPLPFLPVAKFFDSEETTHTAGAFLMKYMHLFDTDRGALLDVYAPGAFFSYHSNAQYPAAFVNADGSTTRQINDQDTSLTSTRSKPNWAAMDRNLARLRDMSAKIDRLQQTPLHIVHLFTQLPATQHKHPETYLIDAWQIPATQGTLPQLHIHVHGELTEVSSNTNRFFDRTFLLIPATPDSRAGRVGWPVQIVNDLLVLRPEFTEEAGKRIGGRKGDRGFKKLSQLEAIARAVANPPPAAPPQTQQHHPHTQLVSNFSQATRLNLEFSRLCLEEHGWDEVRALEGFRQAQ